MTLGHEDIVACYALTSKELEEQGTGLLLLPIAMWDGMVPYVVEDGDIKAAKELPGYLGLEYKNAFRQPTVGYKWNQVAEEARKGDDLLAHSRLTLVTK